MVGVSDYTKGVRVLAGSIPSQRLGSLSIITKTYGTIPSSRAPSASGTLAGARNAGSLVRGTLGDLRLPRSISVGTLTGLFNAGSLNRGTIPAQALQTLPNIPGTLSIVTKTSGTLSIATRALGTLSNQRLPRNVNVGTVSAQIPAGSLTRGSLGINRGPGALGSILKGQIISVNLGQLTLGAGVTVRIYKMTVPPGKTLKLWSVGIDPSAGTALTSTGTAYVGLFSISGGTYYFRGTKDYQAGNPLAKAPAGTIVSFNIANLSTVANRSYSAFFFSTLE